MSYDDTQGGRFRLHPVIEGVHLLDQVGGELLDQCAAVMKSRAETLERVAKRVVGDVANAKNFQIVRWAQTDDVEAVLTTSGELRALVVFAPFSGEVLHELYRLPEGAA